MKHLFLFILLFISSTTLLSQEIITNYFDSNELNEERQIKIFIPKSYGIDSTKVYPLAIVLDADYLFDVFVGNSILFSEKDKAPEQIIVGIYQQENDLRYKDCSYNELTSLPTPEGEAFYRFIRSELFTYMDENYRISPFKTVVGNTLTANFINYFLVEESPGFNAFININPSYAKDMIALLDSKISNLRDEYIYYYLINGNYNSAKKQKSIASVHGVLASKTNENFNYKYQDFTNATTTSSVGIAIPDAFAFVFEMYSAITREEFEKNIKDLSPADAIAYLEKKYVEIEYLFGSNLKIRARDIIAVEPIILDKENGDYLKDFGQMINKLYYESPMGDYYIGRYYETGGKLKQALNYYKSGYMKLPEDDPNADGFYENIERVLKKRDGSYADPNDKN